MTFVCNKCEQEYQYKPIIVTVETTGAMKLENKYAFCMPCALEAMNFLEIKK